MLEEAPPVEELAALLWLNDTSAGRSHLLLPDLGDREALLQFAVGPPDALRKRLSPGIYKALRASRRNYEGARLEELRRWLAEDSAVTISMFDERYPPSLRAIRDPPLMLFVRGELPEMARSVSIIGTRAPSHRANALARDLGRLLARAGLTIVSGLARGIDTEAHCGALDVGGKTAAVLAGSLREIYPAENVPLATDIAASGALVAEVSPLVKSTPRRFVERDRITSGLTRALFVAEASDDSGSLHQARFAADQGRPVFTLAPSATAPHRITMGFKAMLNLGASAVASLDEAEEALLDAVRKPPAAAPKTAAASRGARPLDRFDAPVN